MKAIIKSLILIIAFHNLVQAQDVGWKEFEQLSGIGLLELQQKEIKEVDLFQIVDKDTILFCYSLDFKNGIIFYLKKEPLVNNDSVCKIGIPDSIYFNPVTLRLAPKTNIRNKGHVISEFLPYRKVTMEYSNSLIMSKTILFEDETEILYFYEYEQGFRTKIKQTILMATTDNKQKEINWYISYK